VDNQSWRCLLFLTFFTESAYRPFFTSCIDRWVSTLEGHFLWKKVAGALPCIEVRETEDFASMAITPQHATRQPHALERANPQRNKNKKHTRRPPKLVLKNMLSLIKVLFCAWCR
jgi:hypothetical protein